jgi:uncharacterized cupredoxin-like copper-binding protein
MLRISLLTPFAVAALIAGCGSSSSTSTSSTASSSAPATTSTSSTASAPASGAGGQLSLSETEFKITPASPAVAKTGTITITVANNGKVTHALAVQTPAGIVHTGSIAPGATATLTVNASKPGKYVFYCPIPGHRMLGMQGTLTVGGGSSTGASAPGTATQSSSASKAY